MSPTFATSCSEPCRDEAVLRLRSADVPPRSEIVPADRRLRPLRLLRLLRLLRRFPGRRIDRRPSERLMAYGALFVPHRPLRPILEITGSALPGARWHPVGRVSQPKALCGGIGGPKGITFPTSSAFATSRISSRRDATGRRLRIDGRAAILRRRRPCRILHGPAPASTGGARPLPSFSIWLRLLRSLRRLRRNRPRTVPGGSHRRADRMRTAGPVAMPRLCEAMRTTVAKQVDDDCICYVFYVGYVVAPSMPCGMLPRALRRASETMFEAHPPCDGR